MFLAFDNKIRGIMPDLSFTKYWSSERARKKQTKLTRLSNGLLNEVLEDPFTKDLFDADEIEAMKKASKALSLAKQKFEHIKEQKLRIEKRKQNELNNINNLSKKHAIAVLESLCSSPNILTREQFCLWITAIEFTRNRYAPESWELDINDGIDNHYLPDDNTLRQRHVWSMREKAQEAFADYLKQAWKFSFEDDAWKSIKPINQARQELLDLLHHEKYSQMEGHYEKYIFDIESYNRSVDAIERRKQIKPV